MESTPACVGPENSLRAVRVGRNFAAQAMSVGDDGTQLFLRELRCLRIVAQREHTPGGAHLNHIGAVLDDLAHLVLHVLDAVGDAYPSGVPFVGQQVVIAMSAGDA